MIKLECKKNRRKYYMVNLFCTIYVFCQFFWWIFVAYYKIWSKILGTVERADIKVDKMKKIFALSIIGILASVSANAEYVELHTTNCDLNSMRAELNRAVASHHAVITKIVCDAPVVVEKPIVEAEVIKTDDTCGESFERVVNREYFVRETVQQYKPVVHYEPAGTYTTMRAVCADKVCK